VRPVLTAELRELARSPIAWVGLLVLAILALWLLWIESLVPLMVDLHLQVYWAGGLLITTFMVLAAGWMGLRDNAPGMRDLLTTTPSTEQQLWGNRLAALAAVAAGSTVLVHGASLALLARGATGSPAPRLLADAVLGAMVAAFAGALVGRLTRSRLACLVAVPVWLLANFLLAGPTLRLSPVLNPEARSVVLGFLPDPWWPHLAYLGALAALLWFAATGHLGRVAGRAAAAAAVTTAVVAGAVLVALPDGVVVRDPDPATWVAVGPDDPRLWSARARPQAERSTYPDDGLATTCAQDGEVEVCLYPAFGRELAERTAASAAEVAALLPDVPDVPRRIRSVPATGSICAPGELLVEERRLSGGLFAAAVEQDLVDCALGIARQYDEAVAEPSAARVVAFWATFAPQPDAAQRPSVTRPKTA